MFFGGCYIPYRVFFLGTYLRVYYSGLSAIGQIIATMHTHTHTHLFNSLKCPLPALLPRDDSASFSLVSRQFLAPFLGKEATNH